TMIDSRLDPAARIAARRADLESPDPAVRARALRSMAGFADSSDLPNFLAVYEMAQRDSTVVVASAAVAAIAGIQRRLGVGASAFFARFSAPSNALLRRDVERAFGAAARQAWGVAARPERSFAEYRQIVERWVVPDYEGAKRPGALWITPRGTITL